MQGISEAFTLNNAWKNLRAQAVADGYAGNFIITEGVIMNFNATVMYLHFSSNGATNPATTTDGIPLSNDAAVGPSSSFTLPKGTDISLVWMHTTGNQTIKYSLIG